MASKDRSKAGVLATIILVLAASGQAATLLAGSLESVSEDSQEAGSEVVLYYFHGARRCNTCRSIEAYAQKAIETKYADELASGALAWKVVNTDESENEHFVTDFGLVSSSLVLVEMKGDSVARFAVLQEAWTLVRSEGRFVEYVQRSVGEYFK